MRRQTRVSLAVLLTAVIPPKASYAQPRETISATSAHRTTMKPRKVQAAGAHRREVARPRRRPSGARPPRQSTISNDLSTRPTGEMILMGGPPRYDQTYGGSVATRPFSGYDQTWGPPRY